MITQQVNAIEKDTEHQLNEERQMIRVLLAAWILRSAGSVVEYSVRRIYGGVKGKGTTVLSTSKLREARRKYNAMRIADTDIITITVTGVVAQRIGTVAPKGEQDGET